MLDLGVQHVVKKYSVGPNCLTHARQYEGEVVIGEGATAAMAARRACSLLRATTTKAMAIAIGGTTIVRSSATLKTATETLIGPAIAVFEIDGTPNGGDIRRL